MRILRRRSFSAQLRCVCPLEARLCLKVSATSCELGGLRPVGCFFLGTGG
jgi:hypothetical protein